MRTSNQTVETTTRTNDLKELIQTKLKTLTTDVYYKIASTKAMYPHIVFNFERVDLNDLSRQDYILRIDIWDKNEDSNPADELADKVENLLQAQNLPQTHVLPTFYLMDRHDIEDSNKEIQHREVRFQVQNYER